MVAAGSSNRGLINPYASPTTLALARAMAPADSYLNNNRPPQNMACRSQLRNGSTKTCRRRGGRSKFRYGSHSQRTLDGSRPFSQFRDCKICKVKQYNRDKSESEKKKIPHRGHHPLCPDKKKPVLSPMTEFVEHTSATNLRLNNAPIERVSIQNSTNQGNGQVPNPFFTPCTSARQTTTPTPLIANPRAPSVDALNLLKDSANKLANPTNLRREIDKRMQLFIEGENFGFIQNKRYPPAVGLMIDYIIDLIKVKRPIATQAPISLTLETIEATNRYRQFFKEGNLFFEFPGEFNEQNSTPSPYYHSLEGQRFYYVDWKRAYPSVPLYCFECKYNSNEKVDCHLLHDRHSWSKNKTLFPIWTVSGVPTWCVLAKYTCPKCKSKFEANDARLLWLLDADVSNSYPVLPNYANGTFHFHKDLTDLMDGFMRTYGNGSWFGKQLYRQMGVQYTRTYETYLSRKCTTQYLGKMEFTGKIWPPSSTDIRKYFSSAESSALSPYGYSHASRYRREVQSVPISKNEVIAFDWTFAPLKNYLLVGSKAIFTGMKGSTREWINGQIVQSTGVDQVSHLLIESKLKMDENDPAVLYTDTCPHNAPFYKKIYGSNLLTRLGLFHLMHRVVDTLDTHSLVYWKVLVKLKACFYTYREVDLSALIRCLMDGTFYRDGTKLSRAQIDAIQHSKKWKSRYDAFLQKKLKLGPSVNFSLSKWIDECKDLADDTGRQAFTNTTIKAVNNQLEKVEHAEDPNEIDMYTEIPAGKASSHGLPKWQSKHPESALEKGHESLAHYANGGCAPQLADILTLGGMAAHNVQRRWICKLNELKLKGQQVNIPVEYQDQPPFWDHSYLTYLNERAKDRNLLPTFRNTTPINEDNGIKFLSEYFVAQEGRNQKYPTNKLTKMCTCPQCTSYLNDATSNEAPNVQDNNNTIVAMEQPTTTRIRNSPSQPPTLAPQPLFRPFLIPPSPSTMYSNFPRGWLSIPRDCCLPTAPFYCQQYQQYLNRKNAGEPVRGRPPHDLNCLTRHQAYRTTYGQFSGNLYQSQWL
jgi:hypothetical protein